MAMATEYDFSSLKVDTLTHDFNNVLFRIDMLLYGFENHDNYKTHLPEADYKVFEETATTLREQVWKLKAFYAEVAKRAKALEQ